MKIFMQAIREMINENVSSLSLQNKIKHFENIILLLDQKLDDKKITNEMFVELIELKRSAMGKLYNAKRGKI